MPTLRVLRTFLPLALRYPPFLCVAKEYCFVEPFLRMSTSHISPSPTPLSALLSTTSSTMVHIFALLFNFALLMSSCPVGGCAGFYRGDVRLLFEDIQVLAPTLFISVPRLWNRLYDKVMAAVNAGSSIKKSLFETAFESKVEGLKEGYITHTVWDALVFGAIKARLGGRVRLMVSGAAPLSEAVHTFLRVCFAVPVR